ncbi:MAG: hypothetical protein IPM08_12460 [Actinomycetales bacterium]|nr:hypothetical protein [Actinomycetales bacterium]
MTGMPAGDPASCSHMGGTLRRRAAGLAQAAYPLPADSATGRLAGAVCAQVDRAGRALQGYAQDLAEALATHERLAVRAAAAGLDVQGWRVVEPYGIVTVPTIQARREAAPDLQAALDRGNARLGRARAAVTRELQAAHAALAQIATRAELPT